MSPPGPPVLLTTLTSAVLADGSGDLCLTQESRGAPTEWGGVYGQMVRLTGPWSVRLAEGPEVTDLPSTRVLAEPFPGGWSSRHRWRDLDIVQDVAAVEQPPGALRRLVIRSDRDQNVTLTVTSEFVPYLFPVLVEGIRPPEFEVHTTGQDVLVRHRGLALRLACSVPASHLRLDGASWVGGHHRGPVGHLASEHHLLVPPGGVTEVRWRLVGGFEHDLERGLADSRPDLGTPADRAAERAAADDRWKRETPQLEFPDAPDLELAYRQARSALRQLYTAPADGMVGLVAGYPWYSAIWCRDLAVMLPAVLWLGDFEWVRRSLDTVFRFQSRQPIPLLAGEPGELPMQLAPGPIFLFGTSDSTLRFPAVVEQMHRHAGDMAQVARWADALHRIVRWGQARTDPTTGLLRHGGEAESIALATGALAKVRYGIDAPDTTIWDSADRRDHAVDVQVLWWQTLDAAATLLGHADDPVRRATCQQEAARLQATIAERYPWTAEDFLYDSFRSGRPVPHVRPNALRAVSAGLVEPALARRMVARAARDDLTTPWGVRCLSARDPTYRPTSYHEGQVWTIATAWAADAAYAVGDTERGLAWLRTIASRYAVEAGFAHECYRGDRAEPFDSCFLLGFSVGPFLALVFERLWGLEVLTPGRALRVAPAFPAGWSSARIRGLRLGSGRVDLAWTPAELRVGWSGAVPLSVEAGPGVTTVPAGGSVAVPLGPVPQRS